MITGFYYRESGDTWHWRSASELPSYNWLFTEGGGHCIILTYSR